MTNRWKKACTGNEKGVALFLVIWVLALLSVIVGEFCHAMRTEVNITRNFKEQTEAYYAARAGLMRAIAELIVIETTPPRPPAPEDVALEDKNEIEWRINVEIPDISFAGGSYSVLIGNEAGKVNINEAEQNLLRMMLNKFDLADEEKDVIVDSIQDWRDKDSLHRANGAEDDYYRSLPEPYQAKDGPFESVEELLLVKGVTPEIFHGGLKDIVTVLTDQQDNSPAARGKKRISRRKGGFSYNKININYASAEMLASLPQMTPDLAAQLIEFRKEKDLAMPDVLEIVGPVVYGELSPFVTTSASAKSPFFTISSNGRSPGGTVFHRVETVLKIDVRSEKKYKILQWVDRG